MAKKAKKRPSIRVSREAKSEIAAVTKRPRTRAIAFRLPPDVVRLADMAAASQKVSRNKIVEHTLRVALSRFGEVKQTETPRDQFDLFG